MDDLRRKMLLRQLGEKSAGQEEAVKPVASEEPKQRQVPAAVRHRQVTPEETVPEPLVSPETLAKLNAAKTLAAKAGRAGVALSKQAAEAVVEKTREVKIPRVPSPSAGPAYKKALIGGAVLLAIGGAGAWWWMGANASSPSSTGSEPVAAPAAQIQSQGEAPAAIAPPIAEQPPQPSTPAEEPGVVMPMPVMPAGGGMLDPADIKRRAQEEREQERQAEAARKQQAEQQMPVEAAPTVEPRMPEPVQVEQRKPVSTPTASSVQAKPAARKAKVEPMKVAAPAVDPDVADAKAQEAKLEAWFKRRAEAEN